MAAAGNREAFFTLYDRFLPKVMNRVRAKVPAQDVEDVTQDVFVALVRALGHYEGRSRFNTWLYTIVGRQIADYYRHRQRKEAPGEPVEFESLSEALPAGTGNDDHQDERIQMQQALNRLPEHYQEVILMRFADGLEFVQIAAQRGQSIEAVKSLFRRALQALREAMGEPETGAHFSE